MSKSSGPALLRRERTKSKAMQTTVSLPIEHLRELQEIAAAEKRSVSFLISEAVAGFLKQREKAA